LSVTIKVFIWLVNGSKHYS